MILLILQAASQIFVAPHPPGSPHNPHSNMMTTCPQSPGTPHHHPLCPRQRASSYRLLSATTTTIFLVHAFRRTSATAVCPRYLVFTLCHRVLHTADDQLYVAGNFFRRAYRTYSARPLPADNRRRGASRYGCGSARRCPYQNTRAHTAACISARLGGGPSSTTNERRLSKKK